MSVTSQPQNPKGVLVFLGFFSTAWQLLPCACLFGFYCALTSHFGLLGTGWDTKKPDESTLGHRGLSCRSPACKPERETGGRAWALFIAAPAGFHDVNTQWTRYSEELYSLAQRLGVCDPVCVPTWPNLSLQLVNWCLHACMRFPLDECAHERAWWKGRGHSLGPWQQKV